MKLDYRCRDYALEYLDRFELNGSNLLFCVPSNDYAVGVWLGPYYGNRLYICGDTLSRIELNYETGDITTPCVFVGYSTANAEIMLPNV